MEGDKRIWIIWWAFFASCVVVLFTIPLWAPSRPTCTIHAKNGTFVVHRCDRAGRP